MYYNYSFKNAAEFQQLFKKEHGTRRNKILLSFLKCKDIRRYYPQWLDIASMHELRNICMSYIRYGGCYYPIELNIGRLKLDGYRTDERNGLCEDGDTTCIRLVKMDGDREKVVKLKAGKLMSRAIEQNQFGKILPPQVKTYLCETFAERWQAYASEQVYELRYDDDFEAIYDRDNYAEDSFGSCMTSKGFHSFYENCVKAKAASIWKEDKMYARCVVFTDVTNCRTNETMRLAERQYSVGENNTLKRILVDMLISKGLIDGYKLIGADCHSEFAFVRNDGTEMRDNLEIDCDIDPDCDCVSYQDTFKYYDLNEHIATNDDFSDSVSLEVTDGSVNSEYDEYHDRYCYETVCVHYHGREITCDSDNLDDFYYIDFEYYHEDDCSECEMCCEMFVTEDGYYSELTEETYCCIDCKNDAEERYAKENGYRWDCDDCEWVKINDDDEAA